MKYLVVNMTSGLIAEEQIPDPYTGLGGRTLSRENALETADALNQINPDFIRLRTLALPESTPLAEQYRSGDLEDPIKLRYAKQMCTELGATIENADDIVDSIIQRFI
jgi:radical SAM superfamily enzyme